MFLFGNKIEKLTKFIVKALTKAIKAGNKIISLYEGAKNEIEFLEGIIATLQEILDKIENNKDDEDDEDDTSLDEELEEAKEEE